MKRIDVLGHGGHLVVSCINATAHATAGVLSGFFSQPERRQQFEVAKVPFQFEGVLASTRSGSAHRKVVFVFEPGLGPPGSCAMIANLEDGWQSLAFIASKALCADVMIFGISSLSQKFPSNFFSLVREGKIVRHVSCRRDDGWEFYEEGVRLNIEDPMRYSIRRKQDRIPPEYVVEVATKFGFPLASEEFWKPKSNGWRFLQKEVPGGLEL